MDLKKIPPPEKPPDPEWKPIPGKPHFWINAKGQVRYAPPTPAWFPWGC